MNRRLIKVFLLSSLLMIVVSSCKIFRDDEKGSSNSTSSVSIPVMSPSGGTYSSNQTVTISTETAGSTIYYTTDGTTPSSSSTVYSGTITVTHSETINAIATKSGMSNSEVASEEYVINYAKIPTPLISPVSGVYNTNQDITISSSVSDAQIYYTTDGSPPTMFSSLYTGMFTISTTKVVQAIAIKDQMEDSDVASNDYVLKVVKPVMSPSSGSYSIDTEVTISTDTGSSTIYYTTDGTDPSTSSNVYSTPVVVSGHGNNETIKAIAVKDGWSNSEVSSDAYLINYAKVSTPSISPVSETYNNDQDVTIACSTDGAELYYTTDGSSPTSSSTHYTGLFTISANTTVKAIGIKSQMQNSDVAENIYNLTVAAPVITPVSGDVAYGTVVTITTSTSGANIYYTTNGDTPTEASTLYNPSSKPIITASETFKAKAFKTGYTASTATSNTYNLVEKIYVGGDFSNYGGIYNFIARANVDGTPDPDFNLGSGFNGDVNAIALQSDGKIIAGGNFTSYNGNACNKIARLNADGTFDAGFNTGGAGPNSALNAVAIQSDGKILIGGAFTTYNGTTINRIARLNTNGSLDPDFNVGTGAGSTVSSIAVQSDGKILIGGAFTTYNGTARNEFARLNSNGTLDTGFNIGTGPNGMPYAIAIQSDGKIIIGGYYSFTSYNGVARKQIARVNTDGSLDLSFDPGSLITGNFPMIYSAVIQTDGKILIGGYFTISSGSTTNVSIARINSDGTLDSTFNSPAGMGGTIASMALQSDGKILFNGVAGITSNTAKGIFRINTDGTLDPSFNQGTGANNVIGGLSSTYAPVVIQSNGKILLGGIFRNYYSSSPRGSVTGINLDGTLNTNFNSGAGTSGYNSSGYVYAEAVQNDGKLIIGGWFKKYNGIDSNNLARINVDGVLDTSFNIGTGASSQINSIAIQSDGKILIGGAFTTYNGTTINRLARLNTDGSLDAIFNVGSGSSSGTVNSITIQSDGKILIGGTFLNYNGVNRAGLARITTDGSMDLTFNTGVGSGSMPSSSTVVGSVYVVTLQSNGKILVGGYFTTYNGVPRNRIARINTDGTLDNTFFNNPRDGFEVQVKAIVTR